MRRSLLSLVGFFFIALPVAADAETVTTWDLTEGFAQQGWQANTNLQMTQTANGIRLQPQQAEATLRRTVNITHNIDVLRLYYSTPKEIEIKALWSNLESGVNSYLSPILLEATTNTKIIEIDYTRFETWHAHPTSLGFWLPLGADVTIEKMELVGWNPIEKLGALVRGLWHFDNIQPYSVNFLWGPRMSFHPVQTKQMFWTQPPGTKSANWLMYGTLGIGAVYIWLRKKRWHNFALLIACLWVLYDVRMGAEFLSYTYDDYQTYHSQEVGTRTFRDRRYFNDLASVVAPVVQNHDKFIFVTENRWPYLGLIRYYTYPSIPTHPFDGNANVYPIWIVYRRPDITMNSQGQLVSSQQILSPPGQMLHEFEPGSFIFQAKL